MADSTPSQLPQLPWPVWVGASLVLHAGGLAVALPTMLRVDSPASRSVNIPVTLVDEGTMATAAPKPPPPPVAEQSPQQQPKPLGGQTPTIAPQASKQTVSQQPSPPDMATQKPTIEERVNSTPPEKPVTQPTIDAENPDVDSPDDVIPESPPTADQPAAPEEEIASSEPIAGNGGVAISIVGTPPVPQEVLVDRPPGLDAIALQGPSTLRLSTHHCNDSIPVGDVTLRVEISAEGYVTQAFAPIDASNDVAVKTAQCLLTHAIGENPAAIRLTYRNDVPTDAIQLTVRFAGG